MNPLESTWGRPVVAVLAVATIAGSLLWMYRERTPPPRERNLVHEGLGEVLAEQTITAIGATGGVVLVTLEDGQSGELDVQLNAFKRRIYQEPGVEIIRTDTVSADKSPKYGPGTGMSGRRLLKLVEQHPDAGVIVSLIGVPDPEDEELDEVGGTRPKFIAVARSPKELAELFQRHALDVAIVTRFHFPAPVEGEPKTRREWFDTYFQVVTPDMVAAKGVSQ